MKNLIIIGILSLLLIGSISTGIYFYKEKQRFQANYETSVLNLDRAEILKNGEIEIYHKDIDSLRNALGIRSKTVQNAFQTKYNYKDSTLLIPVPYDSTIFDTVGIKRDLKYNFKSPCYDLKITNRNDTLIHSLDYHDKFTGFLYWERPHKFLFIRWGAKEYRMKLQSDCQNKLIPVDKLIIQE